MGAQHVTIFTDNDITVYVSTKWFLHKLTYHNYKTMLYEFNNWWVLEEVVFTNMQVIIEIIK